MNTTSPQPETDVDEDVDVPEPCALCGTPTTDTLRGGLCPSCCDWVLR